MAALFYELRVGKNTDKIIFMPSKSFCPVKLDIELIIITILTRFILGSAAL